MDFAARGLVGFRELELAAFGEEHDALVDARHEAAHTGGGALAVADMAGADNDEGGARAVGRGVHAASGSDVGRHGLVPGHLGLEDSAELGRVHRHVHGQLEIHHVLVGRVVGDDLRRERGPLVGGQLGEAAAAADGADDAGRGVEGAERDAMLLGELAERLVIGVVAPLLGPVGLGREAGEIELAAVVAVDHRLDGGLQLLEAEHERQTAGLQLLQQVELEGVVPGDGVSLADVDDASSGEVGENGALRGLLAFDEVEPEFARGLGRAGGGEDHEEEQERQGAGHGNGKHGGEIRRDNHSFCARIFSRKWVQRSFDSALRTAME